MRRRTALGAFSLLFLTVCPTDARQHVEAEPEPALESPNHPWWKALEAELAQSTVAQSARSALIVDQLENERPNPSFVVAAKDLLRGAGWEVQVIPGRAVTTELYARLPALGYGLVIVRAHSSMESEPGKGGGVALFTNQRFISEDRIAAWARPWLTICGTMDHVLAKKYLGFGARAVDKLMIGRFPASAIVLMGCDGLASPSLAQALLRRGASDVIGWNGAVSVAHTDRITLLAIEMIASGMEPAAAARRAATELGPDTSSGAQMLVLSSEPSAVAERSIPGVSPQKPTALFPNATLPGTSIRDSP